MKNKSANKKKWLSLLGLTALTAVVAVPAVALTACSTTTDDNGGNTNPNPSPGPGGGGGDTTPTKKEIKIDTTAISRVGSVDDLLTETSTLKPLDEVWEQYLAKNPAEVIVDYENLTPEEMTSLKIEVIDTSTDADTGWGGTNSYEQWSKTQGIQTLEYFGTNNIQINASNIKDLKDNLSSQISKMTSDGTTLVPESIPSLDVSKDSIKIHLKKQNTNYNFNFPVSDINFVSKFDVKVTTDNENLIAPEPQQLDFTYDIGIDGTLELAGTIKKDLKLPKENVGGNNIIPVQKVLVSLGIAEINTDITKITIKQELASKITSIYNVKWEEPTQEDLKIIEDQLANDKLILRATPLEGHFWDDTGLTNTRTITIDGLKIIEQIAQGN